jgi:hypothetical protein
MRHDHHMAHYLLHVEHAAADCAAAFAAWSGFDSPLRHRPAASTCLGDGHAVCWRVVTASAAAALALLPRYVRARTSVTAVRDFEIPCSRRRRRSRGSYSLRSR